MKAIILAAGQGSRLGSQGKEIPKCLVEFEGKNLLRRHIEILTNCGIAKIVLVVGHKQEMIRDEIESGFETVDIEIVFNPEFLKGSILSLWCALKHLLKEKSILLMDADVLYDARMIGKLLKSKHTNCLLFDRNFEPGDEPVKVCFHRGKIVEFRKKINTKFETVGESIGFFKLGESGINWLFESTEGFVRQEKFEAPYEEAIRKVVLENQKEFGFEDATGLPWIEIDFPKDVIQARNKILPKLSRGYSHASK